MGHLIPFATYVLTLSFLSGLFMVVRPPGPGELPTLKITADPAIAFAPSNIDLLILARPDDENRYLAITIQAPDSPFEVSSRKTLAGAMERGELARILYRDVPAGNYMVVVALFDHEGTIRARKTQPVKKMPRMVTLPQSSLLTLSAPPSDSQSIPTKEGIDFMKTSSSKPIVQSPFKDAICTGTKKGK